MTKKEKDVKENRTVYPEKNDFHTKLKRTKEIFFRSENIVGSLPEGVRGSSGSSLWWWTNEVPPDPDGSPSDSVVNKTSHRTLLPKSTRRKERG